MTKTKDENPLFKHNPFKTNDGLPKSRRGPRPQVLNLDNPATIELVANAAITKGLDFEEAIRAIAPKETPPALIADVAERAEQHPKIREAIERGLKARGLDEDSKDEFVRQMWSWLRSDDKELMQTAARILGRGFISEKLTVEKPAALPIEGFAEGIARLTGESAKEADPEEESTPAKETVQ